MTRRTGGGGVFDVDAPASVRLLGRRMRGPRRKALDAHPPLYAIGANYLSPSDIPFLIRNLILPTPGRSACASALDIFGPARP